MIGRLYQYIAEFFTPPDLASRLDWQILENKKSMIEHTRLAEYHAAMARYKVSEITELTKLKGKV